MRDVISLRYNHKVRGPKLDMSKVQGQIHFSPLFSARLAPLLYGAVSAQFQKTLTLASVLHLLRINLHHRQLAAIFTVFSRLSS